VIDKLLALVARLPPEGATLLIKFFENLIRKEPDEALEILRQSALVTASRKAFKRK
jgi:hypothetical protein